MTEIVKDADHFFEGAEKLLEIWFRPPLSEDSTAASLRHIPRDEVEKMLEIAQCHILHHTANESLDSYVLR